MNRSLLPFAALAVGLLPALAGAQAQVDIEQIGQSAGEFLIGVVPTETSIAVPTASPVAKAPPSKEAWGVTVDRTAQILGAVAAPCSRRPSREIVCFLDESIKLSDVRVPGMLGAGLKALLAREARLSRASFRPAHEYTTRNGRAEFSCYHKTREVNCRIVKDKIESGIVNGVPQFIITDRVVCDTITEQSHSCVCTYGCE